MLQKVHLLHAPFSGAVLTGRTRRLAQSASRSRQRDARAWEDRLKAVALWRRWRCGGGTGLSRPNASCCRCTPPPEPFLFHSFKLVTAGGVPAEKILRTQLAACPEWTDARERLALAAAPTTDDSLARVLRERNCASMRKDHMLLLCRKWGYRSSCWSPRADKDRPARGSKKRKAEPPLLLPPGCFQEVVESVWAPVGLPVGLPSAENESMEVFGTAPLPIYSQVCIADPLTLLPLLPLQDRTFQGEGICIMATRMAVSLQPFLAAVAEGSRGTSFDAAQGIGMHWSRVRNIYGAMRMHGFIHDALELRLGALRRYRAELDAEEGSTGAPAYSLDTYTVTPEIELDALQTLMDASQILTVGFSGRHVLPDGSLPPSEAAWLADFQRAHAGVCAIVAVLRSTIAQMRMSSVSFFLDAAEVAIIALIGYTVLADDSMRQRVQWMVPLCERLGAAAGNRALALSGMALLDTKVHVRSLAGIPMHHPLMRMVGTP